MMLVATCRACGIEKRSGEFARNPKHRNGLDSLCKPCRYAKYRAYYEANKAKVIASTKAWATAHKEQVKSYHQARHKQRREAYARNPEKYRRAAREYQAANREKLAAAHRVYNRTEKRRAAIRERGRAARAAAKAAGPCVYFLRDGEFVKIGFSGEFAHRVTVLNAFNPRHLGVIGTMPGTTATEAALHRRFWHLHERGEWFRAENELLAFIAVACSGHESPAIAAVVSP